MIGIDRERDRSEIERLGLPDLTLDHFKNIASSRYNACGFRTLEVRALADDEWPHLETTWARKLSLGCDRTALLLFFEAI